MARKRWQEYGDLGAAPANDDTLLVKDTSDTTDNAVGTVKEVSYVNLLSGVVKTADTDVSSSSWVLDEDNLASNDATKVPTQQSVKAYIDALVASAIGVTTYGGTIVADVQNSFQNIDDVLESLNAPFLTPTDHSAALLEPTSGNLYLIDPSGSETIVIIDTDFGSPGGAQLKRLDDAVRIIPGEGATLNGSNRVAAGGTNEVTDAVFQNASEASVEVASAGSNHDVYATGAILSSTGNDAQSDNNGLYIVTGSTAALLEITKLRGANPVNATTEAVTFSLLDPINLISLTTIRRITDTDIEVNGGTDEDKDFDGSDLTNIGDVTMTGAVSGNSVIVDTAGAGSSQPVVADSGKYITSDGAITIPNTQIGDGWFRCTLEFGGDHDISFNSETLDISGVGTSGYASGDVVEVVVKSATTIRVIGKEGVTTEGAFA